LKVRVLLGEPIGKKERNMARLVSGPITVDRIYPVFVHVADKNAKIFDEANRALGIVRVKNFHEATNINDIAFPVHSGKAITVHMLVLHNGEIPVLEVPLAMRKTLMAGDTLKIPKGALLIDSWMVKYFERVRYVCTETQAVPEMDAGAVVSE
jgi:hypothetical protein